MVESNRGAFYIKAEDVNSADSFTVPGDRTGYTPDDSKNPEQPSYHIDNRQTKYAKQYYVHIKNGWNVPVPIRIEGSSYDDENMTKSLIEQPSVTLEVDEATVFEDWTGHSYLQVLIEQLQNPPTSGTLEIVIQDRL